MSDHETHAEPDLQVYHLENGRVLVHYENILLGGVTAEKAQAIMNKLFGGMEQKEFVDQTQGLSIRKLFVAEIGDISSISASLKGDTSMVLAYRGARTGQLESSRLAFKDEANKQRFLTDFQELVGHEFMQEEKDNTRFESVRQPLLYLLQTLVFGFGLAYFVYYLETATEYSFRIPAVLYFIVEILLQFGYKTVFIIVGVINLIMLLLVIRKWIVPSKQLVFHRNNTLST